MVSTRRRGHVAHRAGAAVLTAMLVIGSGIAASGSGHAQPLPFPIPFGTGSADGSTGSTDSSGSSGGIPGLPESENPGASPAPGRVAGELPIGSAVETISTNSGAGTISIGGEAQPHTSDRNNPVFAVFRAADRLRTESGTVPFQGYGFETIRNRLADTTTNKPGSLVIISSVPGVKRVDQGVVTTLLRAIGANPFTEDEIARLDAGASFSAVGRIGGDSGTAWTKVAPLSDKSLGGNITGFLRYSPMGLRYDFVPGRHTSIATALDSPSNTSNTIRVGPSTQYRSETIPNGSAGFHIVSLHTQTLALRTNTTIDTSARPELLGNELTLAATPDEGEPAPLVIVQSIGKPVPVASWNPAIRVIDALGGNSTAFLAMHEPVKADSSARGDYALIGSLDAGSRSSEAATVMESPTPLLGVLGPQRDFSYLPLASGPLGGVNTSQVDILSQAPTAFPQLNRPAELWMLGKLGLCQGAADSNCSFRTAYDADYETHGSDWYVFATNAGLLNYEAGLGFSDDEFRRTRTQIVTELLAVAEVHRFYTFLKHVFSGVEAEQAIRVADIANAVRDDLAPRDSELPTVAETFSLIKTLAEKLGSAVPAAQPITSSVLSAFTYASYASTAKNSILPAETKLVDPVKTAAGNLGRVMSETLVTTSLHFDTEGRIVVTDYGKLSAAAHAITTKVWALPSSATEERSKFGVAIKQWFAKKLLPVAYPWLIRGRTPTGGDGPGQVCFPMFAGVNTRSVIEATQSYDANGAPIRRIFFPSKANPQNTSQLNGVPSTFRTNTPSDSQAERLIAESPGGYDINLYELYGPRYFGTAHDAREDLRGCGVGRK
ncbi:hypothetical protein [Rhodococcoides kyotonense]|uniref:Uncharacterized protein n=1 Tax=Rhodococcoides kyotonense TaxID=398843 RepID=A0A239LXR2_9NOCA|nr:hypothetical protein [Rhodococcus kyotonensis]SNT35457.1 hypothetical protein SAMN05421642_11514 [Rhodococcus kyotonensis]